MIDDKMFIIGGDSKDQTFFSDMFAFDLTTQTWEECKAKLPSARTGHSCFYHHGYIYVLGGKNGSGYLNECLRCPLATLASWETFQSRGSTFQPRGAHASCIVQNRVFVFGGIRLKRRRDGSSFKYLQDLLCLDMNDRRWSRPTTYGTAPAARAGHTMTVVGQKLYVYGGRYQRAVLGDLYELDTRSMAWSKLRTSGDIPRVRAGHSMSYVFGHLVLWGGSDWNDFFSEIYVCDLTTGTWRRPEVQGKPPSGRFWQSCVVSKQGVLYIFGGGTTRDLYNDLYALDARSITQSGTRSSLMSPSTPTIEHIQGEVVVKPDLEGDRRSLRIGANFSYDQLVAAIKQEYGPELIGDDVTVSLKYKDDEGDFLTLRSDAHLKQAIETYFNRQTRSSLRIEVSLVKKERHQSPLFSWQKANVLGEGAFGTVYLGLLNSGEFIAVKEVKLTRSRIVKPQVEALENEISFMKQLKHENIVQYLGTHRTDKVLQIYLEFVSGGTIHSLLQKFNRLNEGVIRSYIRQILTGLHYLHSKGIIHRDIKAANILVSERGTIKLADFGASKFMSEIAGSTCIEGTVCWMAPEVVRNPDIVSGKADIWSVGCTIIEMASGHIPWKQSFPDLDRFKMFKVLRTTKSGPPVPEHLSHQAHDFLSRCFCINPHDRPSAEELLHHPFVTETLPDSVMRAQESQEAQETSTVESPPSPVSNYSTMSSTMTLSYHDESLNGSMEEYTLSGSESARESGADSGEETEGSEYGYYDEKFSEGELDEEEDEDEDEEEDEEEDSYTEGSSVTSEEGASSDQSQESSSSRPSSSDEAQFSELLKKLIACKVAGQSSHPRAAEVIAPEADMDSIQEYLKTSQNRWQLARENISQSKKHRG